MCGMYPAVELFGRVIGAYTILATAGYLVMGVWACYTARKRGHDDNDMIFLLLVAAVGALLGAHILYGALHWDLLLQAVDGLLQGAGLALFGQRLSAVFGGAVFYGGLAGGLLAGFFCAYKKRLPLPEYADMLSPAIPLFHVFGRIGCFLGGCCYGVPSGFGVLYTHALVPEANWVRRFPVQLAESAYNLLLFFLLAHLLKRNMLKGRLLPLYLLLYALGRFALEFWRGDAGRGFVGALSVSQCISALIIVAAGLFLAATRQGRSKRD